jgi:hypothetical protein
MGPSAKGSDAVAVGYPINCHYRWLCVHGNMLMGAKISTNLFSEKICVNDYNNPDVFCVHCIRGPEEWFGGYQKRQCSGGE